MIEGLEPTVVDSFGGVVTSIDRSDLNNGLAAEAVDMEFFPGGAKSRGPFTGYLTSAASGPLAASPVTSILSFPHPDGHRERLFLHANGTLATEYPEGVVTTIETKLGLNQIMRGCVFNNKAFLAFSDGINPGTRPRWWNGTWFDPVGQEGPTAASTDLVSSGVAGNATPSAANARQYSFSYETRGGFVTLPCVGAVCTNAILVGEGYKVTSLLQPPSNVVKTRLNLTTNLGGEYYSTPALVQSPPADGDYIFPYNSSAGGQSDTELAAAGAAFTITHSRSNCWPVPPCLGLETYNSRLVAWGAMNYIPNLLVTSVPGTPNVPPDVLNYTAALLNPAFNAGLINGLTTAPASWFDDGSGTSAGGAIVERATEPGVCGCAWRITGNGAAAARGYLLQVYQLDRQFAYPASSAYRVRIRAKRSANLAAGQLEFGLFGSGLANFVLRFDDMSTEFEWYDQAFIPEGNTATGKPFLTVNSSAPEGAMTNNETITIDEIRIYPTGVPNLNSYLLFSEVNDPETFDYQRGMYGVNPGDGQSVVNVQTLRGTLYAFKERSLYGVTDNGQAPYLWEKASLMSDTVGCLSVHGVGRGDGYLVTITESGVYVFAGGQPQKISQENQPLWDTVNFNYRHLAWCVVDPDAQRIYIGVPTNGSTFVNELFVIDYVSGLDVDPIGSPGNGRKWSQWTPPGTPGFPCAARIDRDNGQRLFVVGGGTAGSEGFVSYRKPTEWGATQDTFGSQTPNIIGVYETATIGQPQERSFFAYVVAKMRGSGGDAKVTLVRPDGSLVTTGNRTIDASPLHDIEWQIAQPDTQIGLRFENLAGGTFAMKRAAAYSKKMAASRVRGY